MRAGWLVLGMGLLPTLSGCRGGDSPRAAGGVASESLGFVEFGASCAPEVGATFDRGVALLHHMTYPLAASAFETVVERDPDCAMGYWGMAMALFQPLWPNRPTEADLRRGLELVGEARRRGPATERETLFIAAAEAFFDPTSGPDYWLRIERWSDAATRLFEAFPDDTEAKAFFALAHLAVAPRSPSPAENHARAAEVLAEILADHPTHPGAVHYTIHANDFAGREHESLEVVRGYAAIAPENPHALHMPTHIFVRLGDWDEVAAWNRRAAAAALDQRVGPNGAYVWDEYPHAIEYLVYAYLQQARDDEAARAIEELASTSDLEPSFKTAFHLSSTAARYALERQDWEGAESLPVRSPDSLDWDVFWWPEATTWFARGLGAAHLGHAQGVTESLARLRELEESATEAGEALFSAQIAILLRELAAWQSLALGDTASAEALLQEAAALEERTPKHPVTPGPTLPALELLGDLYLEISDYERAVEAYRASNLRAPGRFNGMLGLARAHAALGDVPSARVAYAQVVERAVEGATRASAAEARAYLAR